MFEQWSRANLFNSFPLAVYMCDKQGRITYFNSRAAELWGRNPKLNDSTELYNGAWKIYSLDGKLIQRDNLPMVGVLSTGVIVEGARMTIERPDSTRVIVKVNISPVRNEAGEVIGGINILEDVTEQHNIDEQLQKTNQELKWNTHELEQMTYSASHDLREPLRVAATYIQLLEKKYKDKLDDTARSYIATAVQSCERAHCLINDLLAYNRIRGNAPICEDVDLSEALKNALFNLKVYVEQRKAVITWDPLPTIKGDKTRLTAVFQNLISNSVKFCKVIPQVHISCQEEEETVTVSVADNGIGIEQEYKDKLFNLFQRLHTRADFPGSGLGLAICKKIILQHKGQIWLESTLHKGSTFYFVVPKKNTISLSEKIPAIL
jgi:PAS domain S-box-containing protein